MRPAPQRHFTLLDAMVLIAAMGIALVPVRLYLWENWHLPQSWSASELQQAGLDANIVLVPPGLALTAALWLLRMLPPRPRIRRVFRQPGLAAGTTTMVFALAALMSFVIYAMNDRGLHFQSVNEMNLWTRIGMIPMFLAGNAVAAVWIVMGLSGTGRAEPSWIDRAGRALGIYWITISVLFGWIFYAG